MCVFVCAVGSLEEHLNKLRGIEKEVSAFKVNMEELERFNQDVQEAMIFENRHTPYNMETLRVGWEQLMTSVARATNEVENQILTRDSKGISNEQMDEFRKSYFHFDKNRTRRLEPKEFKACLVSLGYNIRDDRQVRAVPDVISAPVLFIIDFVVYIFCGFVLPMYASYVRAHLKAVLYTGPVEVFI